MADPNSNPNLNPKAKSKKKPLDRRTLRYKRRTTYSIWYMVVKRTTDPKHDAWKDYGGRGIKCHIDWIPSSEIPNAIAFRNFIRDVGLRPSQYMSLDRKDPNGNYEPGNIKWATMTEQNRNKRESIFIPDPDDLSKQIPAGELAVRLGIRYQTLRYHMVRNGTWPGNPGNYYRVKEGITPISSYIPGLRGTRKELNTNSDSNPELNIEPTLPDNWD